MEQKTKFIIIGLAGFAVVCFFLFFQAQSAKQQLIKENEILIKDKTSLENSIDELKHALGDYERKLQSLSGEMEKIALDRDDFQNRYELADKARQELVEKLKSQAAKAQAQSQPRVEPQVLAPANTDAYWAQVLKTKTELEMQIPKIQEELRSLQINNEELQRQKSGLDLEIKSLKMEKEELESQIADNQEILDKITQELVREKNDNIQLQEKYKTGKNEKKALARQLSGLNSQKIDLERKLQEAQKEKAGVEQRFKEMETTALDRLTQINSFKEQLDTLRSSAAVSVQALEAKDRTSSSIELPPIVVRPSVAEPGYETQEAAPAQSAIGGSTAGTTGKILAINKESRFVIIDLGEEAGIRPGDIFGVYRDGLAIASIEVIQSRKDIAACDIKKELQAIKIWDTVR